MIPDADRALVEDWGHFTVPAGTTELHHHHERGADPAIWVRLRFPVAEREAFVRGTGIVALDGRRNLRDSALPDQPWWRPDALEASESGELLQEARRPRYGLNLTLGAAPDDAGQVIAYVFVTGL